LSMNHLPKVEVTFLNPKVNKYIKGLFFDILEDYCERFKVEPQEGFSIAFVAVGSDITSGNTLSGATMTYLQRKRIYVQVRDPLISDVLGEQEITASVLEQFKLTLCHEMVHVCQFLTGRKLRRSIPFLDKDDPQEQYFFDPMEVEARILEHPYSALYAKKHIG